MKPVIVLAGAVAQRPGAGGHAWVFLEYLLGFRRLGLDCLFVDRLAPELCVDELGRACPPERSVNWRYLRETTGRFGLDGSVALVVEGTCLGVTRERLRETIAEAALLVNVNGYLQDQELLDLAGRRVFLDIDPGFLQMWCELGLADLHAGHDAYVTVGANVGKPGCAVPTCGIDWVHTRPPVMLDEWPVVSRSNGKFTSVASWRGPFGPITYQGHTYGLRVHEFRKLMGLPGRTDAPFELALDIHPDEVRDLAHLDDNSWRLVDPVTVAGDPWRYREYVQQSAAELMVPKNLYVDTNSGWFSDRSVCYLATGKPVLARDTGIGDLYPTGEGLLTFSNLDEAAAGVDEIRGNYARHSKAAREIAEEYFDSDKVLGSLLADLGVA